MPPIPGHPLLLYFSVLDMALGSMLAQLDDSGKERVIYYLSKRMLEYECRYIMIESLCLELVWATRRLRHYVKKYSILLVSRLDLLRYLFEMPVLTGPDPDTPPGFPGWSRLVEFHCTIPRECTKGPHLKEK